MLTTTLFIITLSMGIGDILITEIAIITQDGMLVDSVGGMDGMAFILLSTTLLITTRLTILLIDPITTMWHRIEEDEIRITLHELLQVGEAVLLLQLEGDLH